MAADQPLGSIPRDVRRVATVNSTRQDHFFRKQLNANSICQLLREGGLLRKCLSLFNAHVLFTRLWRETNITRLLSLVCYPY